MSHSPADGTYDLDTYRDDALDAETLDRLSEFLALADDPLADGSAVLEGLDRAWDEGLGRLLSSEQEPPRAGVQRHRTRWFASGVGSAAAVAALVVGIMSVSDKARSAPLPPTWSAETSTRLNANTFHSATVDLTPTLAPPTGFASPPEDMGGKEVAFPGGSVGVTDTASGLRITLNAPSLTRLADGSFYQGWLRSKDGSRLVAIGTFHTGADVVLWGGVRLEEFPTLTVTVEPDDGNPASSGKRVLAVELAPG